MWVSVGQCGGGELCAGGCFEGKVFPVRQAGRRKSWQVGAHLGVRRDQTPAGAGVRVGADSRGHRLAAARAARAAAACPAAMLPLMAREGRRAAAICGQMEGEGACQIRIR